MRSLKFRPDGSFRILQLTDMHHERETGRYATTMALLRDLAASQKPDLLAFTGDIVCTNPRSLVLLDQINAVCEEIGIPYTFTFGNHESDGHMAGAIADRLEGYPLCLFERGPDGLGFGNYSLDILSSDGARAAWRLYSLDCGSGRDYPAPDGGILRKDPYITREQISWLRGRHESLPAAPSILFDHVPLPEFNDVWMFDGWYGARGEKVYCPPVNSGLFSALLEMGDFRGVFAGHDHVNSYYGYCFGIMLAYGRNSGYACNCEDYFRRGARVIDLRESSDKIETFIALHCGEREPEAFSPPPFKRFDFYFKQ